jgi:hypothetical protein
MARAVITASARPAARRTLLVIAPAHRYRWPAGEGTVLAARELRRDGVRIISVVDTLRQAFLGAAIAGRLEDFHVAPVRSALDETFAAIGLARETQPP